MGGQRVGFCHLLSISTHFIPWYLDVELIAFAFLSHYFLYHRFLFSVCPETVIHTLIRSMLGGSKRIGVLKRPITKGRSRLPRSR
jgi:hypothetical protein